MPGRNRALGDRGTAATKGHDGSKAASLSDVVRGLTRQTGSKALAGVRISMGKIIHLEAERIGTKQTQDGGLSRPAAGIGRPGSSTYARRRRGSVVP